MSSTNVFDLAAKLSLDAEDYTKGLENAKKSATTIAKIGGTALAGLGAAAGATAISVVKGTSKVSEYGDNVDKMSQKMGISASAYQEWDAIMRHSGTTIDALKPSMKTLALQAEKNAGEFKKLGISENELKTLSKEELFSKVISGLQKMGDSTERTAITSKLLGRGATELGALLNTSAEDTEKMRKRVHELGGVMSDDGVKASAAFQDELQDMGTAFNGLKRNALTSFMPAMTKAMSGITDLMTSKPEKGIEKISNAIKNISKEISTSIPEITKIIASLAPELIKGGGQILVELSKGIIKNLPELANSALQIITQLGAELIRLLPELTKSSLQIIKELAKGITDSLPELLNTMVDVLIQLADVISNPDNLTDILDSALNIVLALVEGITDNIDKLIGAATTVIENLTQFLTKPSTIVKLFVAAVKIIVALGKGLIKALPQLMTVQFKILKSVIDGWVHTDWGSLGKEMINGINNGLKKAWNSIAQWIRNSVASIKSVFGSIPGAVTGFMDNAKNTIVNKINDIKGFFSGLGSSIRSVFIALPGQISSKMKDAFQKIKDAFKGIPSFFTGLWDKIKDGLSTIGTKVGNAIGGAFKTAINAVLKTVENAINFIPGAVNGALSTINKIPGVNIPQMGSVKLPRLALGGIVNKPTQAIIGEAGAEAIVPIEKNTKWIDILADKLNNKTGPKNMVFNINIEKFDGNNPDEAEQQAQKMSQLLADIIQRQGAYI